MHPSALLVKLVTVSSGEKERKIGKERKEEKTRKKRGKSREVFAYFLYVCVLFNIVCQFS